MNDNKLEKGDLVRIDNEAEEWKHLEEKDNSHCLRGHGIVIEVRERKYVVKFGTWTAYLKESDLVKLIEKES